MAIEAQASPERPEISPWFRRFSAWVSRVGAWRATLLASAFASLGSLALTWVCLRLLGHHAMGNAFWISLVVPTGVKGPAIGGAYARGGFGVCPTDG